MYIYIYVGLSGLFKCKSILMNYLSPISLAESAIMLCITAVKTRIMEHPVPARVPRLALLSPVCWHQLSSKEQMQREPLSDCCLNS